MGLNQGAVPGKTGSKGAPVLDQRPTLADAGIDKKLSSRAQKLAAVPEAEFEGSLVSGANGWGGRTSGSLQTCCAPANKIQYFYGIIISSGVGLKGD